MIKTVRKVKSDCAHLPVGTWSACRRARPPARWSGSCPAPPFFPIWNKFSTGIKSLYLVCITLVKYSTLLSLSVTFFFQTLAFLPSHLTLEKSCSRALLNCSPLAVTRRFSLLGARQCCFQDFSSLFFGFSMNFNVVLFFSIFFFSICSFFLGFVN